MFRIFRGVWAGKQFPHPSLFPLAFSKQAPTKDNSNKRALTNSALQKKKKKNRSRTHVVLWLAVAGANGWVWGCGEAGDAGGAGAVLDAGARAAASPPRARPLPPRSPPLPGPRPLPRPRPPRARRPPGCSPLPVSPLSSLSLAVGAKGGGCCVLARA
eukprot:3163200-Rhodomonas_salina.1